MRLKGIKINRREITVNKFTTVFEIMTEKIVYSSFSIRSPIRGEPSQGEI